MPNSPYTVQVEFSMHRDDKSQLELVAAMRGLSVGAFVRMATLAAVKACSENWEPAPKQRRHYNPRKGSLRNGHGSPL